MYEITSATPIEVALDAGTIGVWHWEPATGAMTWNRHAQYLCGLADDAPATFDLFVGGVHPEDKNRVVDAMLHAAAAGSHLRSECRVVNPNMSTKRWVLIEGRKFASDEPTVRLAGIVRDVSPRKRADAQHEIVLQEMEHRIRNVFAVICAIVSLSERTVATVDQLASALRARIGAMNRAYDLTSTASVAAVELRHIVETELAAFVDLNAVSIGGPHIHLDRDQAISMHLIAHELTTNALKYGALSHPGGHVKVQWQHRGDSLVLQWEESGRKRIGPPTRSGSGSKLLLACARSNLGGNITWDYEACGVRIVLVVPNHRLRSAA
jgi:two-component sensor histidine kinase